MKKSQRAIFKLLSKSRLKVLIKIHGLKMSMFDRSRLLFEWEGLEYPFYVNEEYLYLYSVRIQRDIIL